MVFKSIIFFCLLPYISIGQEGLLKMNDGTKLHYYITGKGRDTLIFLHGGPGQNSKGVFPDLERFGKNHVLIAYDQRGCGLSEMGDTMKLSATTHVEDLENFRKHFGLQKLIIIGHSWGCMLAVLYTSKYPERVLKLLLLSPGPPTRKLFQQRFLAFAKKDSIGQTSVMKLRFQLETATDPVAICREINRINEKFYYYDPENLKKKKGNYCDVPASSILMQATTARLTLRSLGDYDLLPLMQKIKQPALIVEGEHTPVPMEELNKWAEALPNSKLLIIKKVGHAYPFVEQPRKFFKKSEKFFKVRSVTP